MAQILGTATKSLRRQGGGTEGMSNHGGLSHAVICQPWMEV